MTARRAEFLRAMRCVANSVSVVTTDGGAGRHGATVSAFCSVSADPPCVLICLRHDSRIATRLRSNGVFCLNVLDANAAVVAERFAGRDDQCRDDRFVGVEVDSGSGAPWFNAIASAFSCRVLSELPCGSHVVILGEVQEVRIGTGQPLARLQGRYGSVGTLPTKDNVERAGAVRGCEQSGAA